MQEKTARRQVIAFLKEQGEDFFERNGRTREDVLQDEETIGDIVREHMETVNDLGIAADYSLERACLRSPGIYKFVPPDDAAGGK